MTLAHLFRTFCSTYNMVEIEPPSLYSYENYLLGPPALWECGKDYFPNLYTSSNDKEPFSAASSNNNTDGHDSKFLIHGFIHGPNRLNYFNELSSSNRHSPVCFELCAIFPIVKIDGADKNDMSNNEEATVEHATNFLFSFLDQVLGTAQQHVDSSCMFISILKEPFIDYRSIITRVLSSRKFIDNKAPNFFTSRRNFLYDYIVSVDCASIFYHMPNPINYGTAPSYDMGEELALANICFMQQSSDLKSSKTNNNKY